MVTETDRNKARSAVVSAYHALDCVTIPFSFLHAFADAAVDAVSTDAEPVAWQPRYKQEVIDHLRTVSDDVSEYAMTVFPTKEQAEEYGHGGHDVRPLYAEPVKTPFEIASKHIPEARVSLLSRAIRQGLNDYGWKNFGTLPEVLMGYIVEAERAEAAAHAEPVKTATAVAVKSRKPKLPPIGNELYEFYPSMSAQTHADAVKDYARAAVSAALSAQVQDVAGERWIDVNDKLPGEQGQDSEEVSVFLNGHCGLLDHDKRKGGGWGYRTGFYDADIGCFRVHGRPDRFVTHWMPLPAAPASKHGDAE